jgi:phosphotransferase system  glucose/maltose/N-acetylglucosamine-specific IIC component
LKVFVGRASASLTCPTRTIFFFGLHHVEFICCIFCFELNPTNYKVLATGDLGDKSGVALVAKVKGDAAQVWAAVEKRHPERLEPAEVKAMLTTQLGFTAELCTDAAVAAMVAYTHATPSSRCVSLALEAAFASVLVSLLYLVAPDL